MESPHTEGSMTLTWSPEAIDDLASLRAHITMDDSPASERVALHIIHWVEELLSNNPQLGHPAACRARANSSSRKPRSLFPTEYTTTRVFNTTKLYRLFINPTNGIPPPSFCYAG
jgi:plasmid stabilization system protein ParE